jgi:hypothetical protein
MASTGEAEPMRHAVVALPLLLLVVGWPTAALAGSFPTRQGESGLLDVPDAELIERRTGMVGLEIGFDHAPGTPDHFGPMPLSLGVGLGRFEWAVSARESGYPGDPRPAPMLFATALKVGLLAPSGLRPGVAIDGYLDRFNDGGAGGGRLILSTGFIGPFRVAGFAGYEKRPAGSSGLTAGLAAVARHASGTELVVEGLTTPRGGLASAALRYELSQRVGIGLVGSYLPDDKEYRIALALGFHASPVRRAAVASPAPTVQVKEAEPEAEPALAFGDRPRFKLRIHATDPSRLGEPRHRQYAPYAPQALAATGTAAPPRAATPAVDEVAAAQLRDRQLQAEARLKRLRATDEALTSEEARIDADARTLDERERNLASREAQLDARERRIMIRAAPNDQQRQLESREAQLGVAERQLAAQERGFTPTREAALGTERDALAREQAERREAERRLAQADAEKTRTRQGELRRQALAAQLRMLAAMEIRLVARGERVDAASRQQRARGERVDTRQRRLDVRAERLDLLEQQAAVVQRGGTAAPAPGAPLPSAGEERGSFTIVVQSPTVTRKVGGLKAGGGSPQRDTLHPGVAVEKAVAAAAVVSFPTLASTLPELDREAIDGIARLASRESCEVLVWARAKDPSLMNEASRRADELKALIVRLGDLPPNQVVTRITTRPGAQGVDVVVSALRENGRTRGDAAVEAAPSGLLAAGETARHQVRDSLLAVQPAIERCISEQMVRHGLIRAEGSLELTVSPAGRVTGTQVGSGGLGGGELEACLKAASSSWQFPAADGEYVVDVPITVVGGGVKP